MDCYSYIPAVSTVGNTNTDLSMHTLGILFISFLFSWKKVIENLGDKTKQVLH